MHRNLFAGLPIQPMSVIPLLQQAMSENKVSGEIHSGVWVDVGTPERLQEVQERYAASGETRHDCSIQTSRLQAAVGDRLAGSSPEARIPDGGRTQRIFNRTMFVLMGKLAKLDGRVVDGEIQYATQSCSCSI